MSTMQLYVWGAALNSPSIDPKCVVVEAYLRLIKQKYTVVTCNNPQTSPTGKEELYYTKSSVYIKK
jgi:sorting and assembly machinery component 37/metaxin